MKIKAKSSKLLAFFLCICMAVGMLSPATTLKASAASGEITDFWVGFSAQSGEKPIDSINWYYQDGEYYMFMPAYTEPAKLSVNFAASADVYITCSQAGLNKQKLVSGEQTDVVQKVMNYKSTLTCSGRSYTLNIMKSAKIPAMYLTTESGTLDKIHENKDYKEKGNIKVVKENGDVDCDSSLKSIKGRGNASWVDFSKKPYNIKFDAKTDLLGMGKAKGWCLIANASDHSFIRNKIAYDSATAGGIEFTSDSRYVDLYINSNYMGNYLVTEKIEIGKTSVDITDLEKATEEANEKDLDAYGRAGEIYGANPSTQKWCNIPNDPEDITGGYLLEFELNDRYPNEISGFVTNMGQSVVMKYPEYGSERQVSYISSLFQDVEDAVYSKTGRNAKGKHYSEYLDLDSFAKMYLVQEFAANLDNAITSFFVYKESDKTGDGKFHAAPVWDFDNAFGYAKGRYDYDLRDPHVNWTENGIIYNSNNVPHMFNMLYNQSDGKLLDEICYEWFHNFNGVMDRIVNDGKCEYSISYLSGLLDSSLKLESVRWNSRVDRDMLNYFIPERLTYFGKKFANMNNVNSFTVSGLEDQKLEEGTAKPTLTVKNTYGRVLKENTDYRLEYNDNDKVGTGSVKIIGIGSCKSSRTYYFNIVQGGKKNISGAKAVYSESGVYTGGKITPKVTLAAPYDSLKEGVDYSVSYSSNINAGNAKITITGIGNCEGAINRTFIIKPASISSATVRALKTSVYTGKTIAPSVSVKRQNIALVKNKDYTVAYKNNKNIGKATVTIKGVNNYSGTKTVRFKIEPKKVSGLRVWSKNKKTAVVSFKKVKKAKKYIIIYSTSKSFRKAKKKTSSKALAKLVRLKSKKRYYVKVAAFANGISGKYSAVKRVRVK